MFSENIHFVENINIAVPKYLPTVIVDLNYIDPHYFYSKKMYISNI